ncbi:MAG: class I SAM-dependent methyltransferase [Balneolaceae bacterium]
MPTPITHALFTEKAEAYAQYRPEYPSELIDHILHPYRSPGDISAIDVGAGTGIASRILGDRGIDVIAAEPNSAMIESAEAHPKVKYVNMSAENLEVESSSANLVTVFQAFHWFNFKKSLQEFNRVLEPTGQLALIWSYWDLKDPFTARYSELIHQAASKNPGRVTPYDKFPGFIKKMRIKMLWRLRRLPYFKNIRRYRYNYVRDVSLEMLIGDARSQSYINHNGNEWEELLENIKSLHHNNNKPQLVYSINLFTARPNK